MATLVSCSSLADAQSSAGTNVASVADGVLVVPAEYALLATRDQLSEWEKVLGGDANIHPLGSSSRLSVITRKGRSFNDVAFYQPQLAPGVSISVRRGDKQSVIGKVTSVQVSGTYDNTYDVHLNSDCATIGMPVCNDAGRLVGVVVYKKQIAGRGWVASVETITQDDFSSGVHQRVAVCSPDDLSAPLTPEPVRELFQRSMSALDAGDTNESKAKFTALLAVESESLAAWPERPFIALTERFGNLGEVAKLDRFLSKLQARPERARVEIARAYVAFSTRLPEKAMDVAKLLHEYGRDSDSCRIRAMAFAQSGDAAKSCVEYRRSSMWVKDPSLHLAVIGIAFGMKDTAAVKTLCDELASICWEPAYAFDSAEKLERLGERSQSVETIVTLGKRWFDTQDVVCESADWLHKRSAYREESELTRRTLDADPKNFQVWWRDIRAIARIEKGEEPLGLRVMECLGHFETGHEWAVVGNVLVDGGRAPAACKIMTAAREKFKDDGEVLQTSFCSLWAANKLNDALVIATDRVASNDKSEGNWLWLAAAKWAAGDKEGAVDAIGRAAELSPNSDDVLAFKVAYQGAMGRDVAVLRRQLDALGKDKIDAIGQRWPFLLRNRINK
jgi:tetratricopeptide (TPR) repeat protein